MIPIFSDGISANTQGNETLKGGYVQHFSHIFWKC